MGMNEFYAMAGPTSHNQLRRSIAVFWLQGITLAWMLVECGVALYAAVAAHSPAMLAFGSDSLIELLSAAVVLLQFVPRYRISEKQASRSASVLLVALAVLVAVIAILALSYGLRPEVSVSGICITLAALVVMPILAGLKRAEARRSNNAALAADAVQSATCAYLASITVIGLALNAIFRIEWSDSAAALLVTPLLVMEAKKAWRGQVCQCCDLATVRPKA